MSGKRQPRATRAAPFITQTIWAWPETKESRLEHHYVARGAPWAPHQYASGEPHDVMRDLLAHHKKRHASIHVRDDETVVRLEPQITGIAIQSRLHDDGFEYHVVQVNVGWFDENGRGLHGIQYTEMLDDHPEELAAPLLAHREELHAVLPVSVAPITGEWREPTTWYLPDNDKEANHAG